MMDCYPFFPDWELACRCGKCNLGAKDMCPETMSKIISIRTRLGFALPVSSAVRCIDHNTEVSVTGNNGPHTILPCKTVDIRIYGNDAFKLVDEAMKFGVKGIGIKQNGPHHKRFIHLDWISPGGNHPRPWIWSY